MLSMTCLRLSLLALLALLLVAWSAGAAPAADPVRLDADLRARLAALAPLGARTYDPAPGPVTLVTFFASWCPPCREEFRHLNKLRTATDAKDLTIVAINILEDWEGLSNPAKLKRFLKQTKPDFITLKGDDAIAQTFENVTRIPTVFVFDRDGRKTTHFVHKYKARKMSLTYDELLAAVRPLF